MIIYIILNIKFNINTVTQYDFNRRRIKTGANLIIEQGVNVGTEKKKGV